MSGCPEVTVVIPTRDRWPLLSAYALRAALSQEDVELEVVVVDDGSTDGTPEAIEQLGDPRVRVLRQPRPAGPSAARNRGIDAARAPWVAFLDDDDLWSPRKLRVQLDAAASSGADWTYTASVNIHADGAVAAVPPLADPSTFPDALLRGNVLWGGCSTVAADAGLLRRLGGFDEGLTCFEDWDLWIRLARSGRAAAVPEALVACVEHPGRRSPRAERTVVEQHERMLARHRQVTRADRMAVLEWLADEQLRAGRRLAAARLYLRAATRHRSLGNLVAAAFALFGETGLRAAARLHLAVRGRTHLGARAAPRDRPELSWLPPQQAGST